MEAVILAGGLGTRLRSVVSELPKPMAPVKGRPFLEHVLSWMSNEGVGRAVLSVGYRWEAIHAHFGDEFRGMSLDYCVEETPLGTGGAVAAALGRCAGRTVLVVNGDTIFPIPLRRLHAFQDGRGSGAALALKRMEKFDRYGTVVLEDGVVASFEEKRFHDDGLINGGIYAMDRSFLSGRGLPERFSLEKDVLEKEAGSGTLRGEVFDAPFLDIGIPEDYARAEEFL